jgi:hypothetical protein
MIPFVAEPTKFSLLYGSKTGLVKASLALFRQFVKGKQVSELVRMPAVI